MNCNKRAGVYTAICCLLTNLAAGNVELVDFGLPSGNLWAICNIGAKKPWDAGNYYAWGETTTKSDYSWETYKYCNGRWNGITKYGKSDNYCAEGFSDSLRNLEPIDDVAYITYGDSYMIPTVDDWHELFNNSYMQWTDNYNDTGTKGCIIYRAKKDEDKGVFGKKTLSSYSLADTHIFLPVGGYMDGTTLKCDDTHCVYWTSTVSNICSNNGRDYIFFAKSAGYSGELRCEGLLVRAIKKVRITNKDE